MLFTRLSGGTAMKIQLESRAQTNVIRGYSRDGVTINRETYRRSVVVTPERIVADWRPDAFAELTAADFEAIRALDPEIVLLGTGSQLRFPAAALTRSLIDAGIGLEVMDTGAACRTYNVLMNEGRRVAAALLIIAD